MYNNFSVFFALTIYHAGNMLQKSIWANVQYSGAFALQLQGVEDKVEEEALGKGESKPWWSTCRQRFSNLAVGSRDLSQAEKKILLLQADTAL